MYFVVVAFEEVSVSHIKKSVEEGLIFHNNNANQEITLFSGGGQI